MAIVNDLSPITEELAVPYVSPLDNRTHRYFPDFIVVVLDKNKNTKTIMVEVKPKSQTKEPPRNKNKSKYMTEVARWGVNKKKWESAAKYCEDKGWEFKILTEADIFGSKK
jgi:ribosomal protein S30